jgi:DNA-binding CsgD family transcriptional regulator/tetratricopeptide (TPR) repeat protein
MLQEQAGLISFRHEIARRAVLDAMAPAERAGLHADALRHLRSAVPHADVMRLTQHAIESGDGEAILALAPRAADRAAGLGAHGEAADYLAVALGVPSAMDDATRAGLLERYAGECSLSDRVPAARSAQEEALATWQRLEEPLRAGDGLRALSGYMWLGGEGERARETAESAVSALEPIIPHGHEMALALATVAQRRLVAAQDDEAAAAWARRALDLAERIGDEPVAIHALTTLAAAEIYQGVPGGWERLEEALARARAGRLSDAIARALINLVEAARDLRRYDLADRYVDEAASFLGDHGFELYRRLLGSRIAELALERGRWSLAEHQALALLDERARSNQVRVRALVVLGRLRARRGEPGAWAALDEAAAIVGPGELQEICPLHAARAEAAWLEGDLVRTGDEAVAGLDVGPRVEAELLHGELAFWAWRAGRIEVLPEGSERGYALHAAGRFREAAEAWAAVGCPYQQAAALADSDTEADLREALAILHALGAGALGRIAGHRLRGMGARRIPRGPRPSTRSNPAGLSTRELEILLLVREGARNSDIAERLVLSPKTVDHHVSAILRKLGVADRAAACREAERLGLQVGGPVAPS